jgi:hypothetical protein
VSFPPLAAGRSQAIVWVLELSTIDRTFSTSLAFAMVFGITFYLHILSLFV